MTTRLAARRLASDAFQPGEVEPRCHPDRLASIALLFGMEPQPVDACRVLEIGCGAGLNMLPMADRHPRSQFVGRDRSSAAIATARQLAQRASLDNVEFQELALEAAVSSEAFDYILCHDLLTRLPIADQAKLLGYCRQRLKPAGVLYLGVRTLPGWIVPSVVRDLARSGADDEPDGPRQLARVRAALAFIAELLPDESNAWENLLREEVRLAAELPDVALAHEYLEPECHPLYFHELAFRAAEQGLQYLGDADIPAMFAGSLGEVARKHLAQSATDAISHEQHMDLLCNRAARHGLFCRGDARRTFQWNAGGLSRLYLAAHLQEVPEQERATPSGVTHFMAADGRAFGTSLPAAKAALGHLASIWPRSIHYDALLEHVAETVPDNDAVGKMITDAQRQQLAAGLLECIASGLVEVRSSADRFTLDVPERPTAGGWARIEAELLERATNLRHEPATLDEMSLRLLTLLDGTRDREALLEVLRDAVSRGQLSILREGLPAGTDATEILSKTLDQSLNELARQSLLIA